MLILGLGLFSTILVLLAGIHIYWGHGGNWPGENRQDLIDKVYGSGDRFPSMAACYVVAFILFVGAGLTLSHLVFIPNPVVNHSIVLVSYLFASAFLLRGLGGYWPFLEKMWKPIFVKYNRIYYGPLCIFLGLGFLVLANLGFSN